MAARGSRRDTARDGRGLVALRRGAQSHDARDFPALSPRAGPVETPLQARRAVRARNAHFVQGLMADADWNNAAAVANSAAIVADWEARSARLRAQHKASMDLRYGPAERNRIDFFPARPDSPLLAFIHGGYWQARSKDIFSFIAEGPLACG